MPAIEAQASESNLSDLSEEALLLHLEDLKATLAKLTATQELLTDELSRRLEAGDIDPTFSHNDWTFNWSAGRRSWSYPPSVKALEEQAKAAKKASEADGTAHATTGTPYWTIRAPKP
ncbi:MAG: hypothetical protein WCF98_10245 [Synechococcus sp. ELA057]|jgi:hypothetical protein